MYVWNVCVSERRQNIEPSCAFLDASPPSLPIVVCTENGLLESVNESRKLTRTHSLSSHPATSKEFSEPRQRKSGQHTKHATASPWQHSHSQARPSQPCGRWPCLVVRRGGKPRASSVSLL